MRTLVSLALLHLLLATALPAQPIEVRIYTGLEGHDQNGLDALLDAQQKEVQAMGVPVRRVADFPTHVAVHVEAMLPLTDVTRLSAGAGYGSTGSRLHYSDYSGEIALDMVAERWHLSLGAERPLPGPLPLWATLQARYSFSDVTNTSRLRLYEQSSEEDERLTARGLSLVAGAALELERGPVTARLSGAFEYAFTHWLQLDALTHRLYYDGEATTLHGGWTGLRTGVALGYRF